MTYVYDTGIFIDIFRHYPSDRFTSLRTKFDHAIANNLITSTREVLLEIRRRDDALMNWAEHHKTVFSEPTGFEMNFVNQLFRKNPHFKIKKEKILVGGAWADPFVIAKAYTEKGCVVTTERPNGVKIPTICEIYNIECINFEGFMRRENWKF